MFRSNVRGVYVYCAPRPPARYRSFFLLQQMTSYELRISYWSSDVCSSDLPDPSPAEGPRMSFAFDRDGPRVGPASGGAAQQLVILLHGVGADGQDQIGRASCRERVFHAG